MNRDVTSMQKEIAERKDDLKSIDDPWLQGVLEGRIKFLSDMIKWETQPNQCTGSGYSHGPHGGCTGYSTDRT